MKTNFRNNNFALSLAFIIRFKVARKWSIFALVVVGNKVNCNSEIQCLATVIITQSFSFVCGSVF